MSWPISFNAASSLNARTLPAPDKLVFRDHTIDLNSSRLTNDAPEEFVNGAFVKRSSVEVLQTSEHVSLAIGIAKRELLRFFNRANLKRESRAHVQEAQQFGVDFVDFLAPVLDVHVDCSVYVKQKKQPRLFRIAAGSFEGVVLFF